jgi:hypothetical protein
MRWAKHFSSWEGVESEISRLVADSGVVRNQTSDFYYLLHNLYHLVAGGLFLSRFS